MLIFKFELMINHGTKAVDLLKKAKNTIKGQLQTTFRREIDELSKSADKMDDNIHAPRLSSKLFEKAQIFIAAVQNIELALHNLEKELYKHKMQIYKYNNEGRAKMDASVSLHPWGYNSQSAMY